MAKSKGEVEKTMAEYVGVHMYDELKIKVIA